MVKIFLESGEWSYNSLDPTKLPRKPPKRDPDSPSPRPSRTLPPPSIIEQNHWSPQCITINSETPYSFEPSAIDSQSFASYPTHSISSYKGHSSRDSIKPYPMHQIVFNQSPINPISIPMY